MYTMEIYIHVNNVVILLYFATSVFIVTPFILFPFLTILYYLIKKSTQFWHLSQSSVT